MRNSTFPIAWRECWTGRPGTAGRCRRGRPANESLRRAIRLRRTRPKFPGPKFRSPRFPSVTFPKAPTGMTCRLSVNHDPLGAKAFEDYPNTRHK